MTEARRDAALARCPGVFDYQLRQDAPGLYAIAIVAEADAPADVRGRVEAALGDVYGANAQVCVTVVNEIEASASGKFRRAAAAHAVASIEL